MAGDCDESPQERALSEYRTTPYLTDNMCVVCKKMHSSRWFVAKNDASRLLCKACLEQEIETPLKSAKSAPLESSPEVKFLGVRQCSQERSPQQSEKEERKGGAKRKKREPPLKCMVVKRGSKVVGIARPNPQAPIERSRFVCGATEEQLREAAKALGIVRETETSPGGPAKAQELPPRSDEREDLPILPAVPKGQPRASSKGVETTPAGAGKQGGASLSGANLKKQGASLSDTSKGAKLAGRRAQRRAQRSSKGGTEGGSTTPAREVPSLEGAEGGASGGLGGNVEESGSEQERLPLAAMKRSPKRAPKQSPEKVTGAGGQSDTGSGGKRCDECGAAESKRWYGKSRGICLCNTCYNREYDRSKRSGAGGAETQNGPRGREEAQKEGRINREALQPGSLGKGEKRKRGGEAGAPSKKKKEAAVAEGNPRGSIRLDGELVSRRVAIWWPLDKKFYNGRVVKFSEWNGLHQVRYDDGIQETVDFSKERWKLLGIEAESLEEGEGKGKDKGPEQNGRVGATEAGRGEPNGKDVQGSSGPVNSGRGSQENYHAKPSKKRSKRHGDDVSAADVAGKKRRRKATNEGVPATRGASQRGKAGPGGKVESALGACPGGSPEGVNLRTFVGELLGILVDKEQRAGTADELMGAEGEGDEVGGRKVASHEGSGGARAPNGTDDENAVRKTAEMAVVLYQPQAGVEPSPPSLLNSTEHLSSASRDSPPSQNTPLNQTTKPIGAKSPVVTAAFGKAPHSVKPREGASRVPAADQAGGSTSDTAEKEVTAIHPKETGSGTGVNEGEDILIAAEETFGLVVRSEVLAESGANHLEEPAEGEKASVTEAAETLGGLVKGNTESAPSADGERPGADDSEDRRSVEAERNVEKTAAGQETKFDDRGFEAGEDAADEDLPAEGMGLESGGNGKTELGTGGTVQGLARTESGNVVGTAEGDPSIKAGEAEPDGGNAPEVEGSGADADVAGRGGADVALNGSADVAPGREGDEEGVRLSNKGEGRAANVTANERADGKEGGDADKATRGDAVVMEGNSDVTKMKNLLAEIERELQEREQEIEASKAPLGRRVQGQWRAKHGAQPRQSPSVLVSGAATVTRTPGALLLEEPVLAQTGEEIRNCAALKVSGEADLTEPTEGGSGLGGEVATGTGVSAGESAEKTEGGNGHKETEAGAGKIDGEEGPESGHNEAQREERGAGPTSANVPPEIADVVCRDDAGMPAERVADGVAGTTDREQELVAGGATGGSHVDEPSTEREAKVAECKEELDPQEQRLENGDVPSESDLVGTSQQAGEGDAQTLVAASAPVEGSTPGIATCQANESVPRGEATCQPKEGLAAGSLWESYAKQLPGAERYGSLWSAYADRLPEEASKERGPAEKHPQGKADSVIAQETPEAAGRALADREFLAAIFSALSVWTRTAGVSDGLTGTGSTSLLQRLEPLRRMGMAQGLGDTRPAAVQTGDYSSQELRMGLATSGGGLDRSVLAAPGVPGKAQGEVSNVAAKVSEGEAASPVGSQD